MISKVVRPNRNRHLGARGAQNCVIRKMTVKDANDASQVSIDAMVDSYKRYENGFYPEKAHKFDVENCKPAHYIADLESKYLYSFVLEVDGRIIGVVKGKLFSQSGYAMINWICIHPSQQRNGYGSKLIKYVMKYIKKNKCHKLSLNTMAFLIPAMSLYLRTGFVPEAYLRKQWWNVDFVQMSIWLD